MLVNTEHELIKESQRSNQRAACGSKHHPVVVPPPLFCRSQFVVIFALIAVINYGNTDCTYSVLSVN